MTLPLKTIVVADDERSLRDFLSRALEDIGYTVSASVEDGQRAVEAVRQFKPDLLLIDLHMPQMGGIAAAKIIVPLETTAIVMMTADPDSSVARQAMDLGVSGYLNKPFGADQLTPMLESSWHRFQTVRSLQNEMKALQENLETRKLLEKAKGILMEQQGYGEEDAHKTIQKMSQDQGISVKELCRSLIQVRMVLGGKPKTVAPRKAA